MQAPLTHVHIFLTERPIIRRFLLPIYTNFSLFLSQFRHNHIGNSCVFIVFVETHFFLLFIHFHSYTQASLNNVMMLLGEANLFLYFTIILQYIIIFLLCLILEENLRSLQTTDLFVRFSFIRGFFHQENHQYLLAQDQLTSFCSRIFSALLLSNIVQLKK